MGCLSRTRCFRFGGTSEDPDKPDKQHVTKDMARNRITRRGGGNWSKKKNNGKKKNKTQVCTETQKKKTGISTGPSQGQNIRVQQADAVSLEGRL